MVKYWGLWLPVPTVLAIITSLFWNWLIFNTIGLSERPRVDAREAEIVEHF